MIKRKNNKETRIFAHVVKDAANKKEQLDVLDEAVEKPQKAKNT